MLSAAQVDRFVDDGYVHLGSAFPADVARRCCEEIWAALDEDPQDPSTWTRPVARLTGFGTAPFREAANTPALHEAFDQLVGAGRWVRRDSLGTIPVRFPVDDEPGDDGWHIDANFAGARGEARVDLRLHGRALLMLFLFTDVGDEDAPTRIRAGSHLDVPPFLRDAGDGGREWFELCGDVVPGIRPVALLRDPARLDPRWRDRVETVAADQTDADAVREATRGADRLFWVNPPAPPEADPLAHHALAAEAVEAAVTTNAIGFVVFQSSVGAELRHGAGDIDGLGRTEEALDATGADVLHLRCGYFFTNLLMQAGDLQEGRLPTPWPLEQPLAWVDPRDIGDVAAARLLAGPGRGPRVQAVHGPEDLSFGDAADVLGGALGRPVEAVRISGDEFRAGLRAVGLGPAHVEAVAGMSEGLSCGFVPDDPRDPTTTTPTTLAAWAHTRLRC